ncbi:MAG TPA: ImmA/IrrE family metallo-endopeptidase, partial [Chloroflexia bacterium]|nr:ImmA/IrrE family metallo-endopeptidase [Chloroflexia bacterium]
MPRTERWKTIQTIAAQQRATFPGRDTPRWQVALPTDSQDGGRSTEHCLRQLAAQGLDVFPLPPGDPLLGGARAVFDREFVAYDAGLPPPAVAFSLAHELGHALLHGGQARCSAADIDEECTALAPASPVAVETYSPRQQRELEANAFAAAFLMPPAELRAGFLAGLRYTDLAARYGVSESAMLNTLAAVLLGPPPAVVSRQSSVVSNESVGSLQDAVGRDDAVSGPGPAERAGDEGQGSDRPQSKIHDEGLG